MAPISSHLLSCFYNSFASTRIRKVLLSCFLSSIITCFYISSMWIANDRSNLQSIIEPTCPIRDNIDVCVHRSADLTILVQLCPNITSSVASCQDRMHDLIIADKEFIEELSSYSNLMIVPGSNIGEELDSFVQKNSRWIIDVMGGKGYEVLTSVKGTERLRLQKELDQLQNGCDNFFYGAKGIYGFGSRWHILGLGLAHSTYYNMTLYPIDKYNKFIPITTCTEADLERSFSANTPESVYANWNASTTNYKSSGPDDDNLMRNSKIIKPEYQHMGHFWWRSMLTYYAIRPNFKLRESIRRSSVPSAQCMSMHVRHSDKGGEAKLISFSKYMQAARRYKSRTGVSNIYLMTDDPEVISSSESFWYKDFQFHYMDLPRTNKGWSVDVENGLSLDVQEENFLIDIYSAVQCEHSIVTYSSNVGRLIAEIMYATKNTEPDVVSLDVPWLMFP